MAARLVIAGAAALSVTLAAAGVAEAKVFRTSFLLNQATPQRAWDETASLPFLVGGPVLSTRSYRHGRDVWRGIWVNSSFSRLDATEALAGLFRDQRFGSDPTQVAVVDRPLRTAERRRLNVVADLYRDADVLVVAAGHPACAGITRAAARGLVAGRLTRWSQVVAGGTGTIRLRYQTSPSGFAVPRMGVPTPGRIYRRTVRYAPGAAGALDGGLAVVRAGDRQAVALTSWSRARYAGSSACLVPIDGVAPDAASVSTLRYPEAYAVRYAMARPVARRATRAYVAIVRREAARVLTSGRVKEILRGKGLWVVGDPLPAPVAPAPVAPAPPETTDPAPEPVPAV